MKKLIFPFAVAICFFATQKLNAQTLADAFSKSYTLESAGKYTEAADVIKANYDEKSYEINMRLGYLNYEAKQYAASSSYYLKAVTLMPYSIEAKFGYVLPLSSIDDWTKVTTQYQDILKIDPQNSKANYYLGLIYYNNKDYTNAHSCLEKVVNLFPFDYDGLILFAWTNFQMGKTTEAKALFNKVMLLSPKDASATEGLALIK